MFWIRGRNPAGVSIVNAFFAGDAEEEQEHRRSRDSTSARVGCISFENLIFAYAAFVLARAAVCGTIS